MKVLISQIGNFGEFKARKILIKKGCRQYFIEPHKQGVCPEGFEGE